VKIKTSLHRQSGFLAVLCDRPLLSKHILCINWHVLISSVLSAPGHPCLTTPFLSVLNASLGIPVSSKFITIQILCQQTINVKALKETQTTVRITHWPHMLFTCHWTPEGCLLFAFMPA